MRILPVPVLATHDFGSPAPGRGPLFLKETHRVYGAVADRRRGSPAIALDTVRYADVWRGLGLVSTVALPHGWNFHGGVADGSSGMRTDGDGLDGCFHAQPQKVRHIDRTRQTFAIGDRTYFGRKPKRKAGFLRTLMVSTVRGELESFHAR